MNQDYNQSLVKIAQCNKGQRSSNKAIEELIERNGGLIWETVKHLTTKKDFPYIDDILNVCRASILKALDTYKFNNKAKFVTWWVIHMRPALQSWRREQGGELYLNQIVRDKMYLVNHYHRSGNKASEESSSKRVEEFKGFKDVELEKQHYNHDGVYEVDLKNISSNIGGLMGEWSIDGDQGLEIGLENIYKLFDSPLLKKLNKREIRILEYKFNQNITLCGIGELVGLSKERVRQVLIVALGKIKKAIELNKVGI